MARSPSPTRVPPPADAARHSNLARYTRYFWRRAAAWHTICIPFLASGCLILSGPWGYYRNTLPEEVNVSPSGVLQLDTSRQTILVEFFDEDQDDLVFTWFVEGRQQTGDAVNESNRTDAEGRFIEGSVLTVNRADVTDGAPIFCLIEDAEQTIRLNWTVVLQESQ